MIGNNCVNTKAFLKGERKLKIDDLKSLPAEALQELISNARKLLDKYEEEKKKKVIKEIHELAASADLNVEIKDDSKHAKLKSKGVIKFRNPDDPRQTWTGRGKRPRWLNDKLNAGKDLQDFAIKH